MWLTKPMKRAAILPLLLTLAIGAAQADDWSIYHNARFGYQIDIPPSFSGVAEAENGDGGISSSADSPAELRVWGGYLTEGNFDDEVQWRIDQDITDRWIITYQKWKEFWASWSGVKGDRVIYQRAIEVCDGAAAYFRLEYDKSQVKAFDKVIARLVKSLRSAPC